MPLFFFSSRRRHTRWPRDWSSDVCSSDLERPPRQQRLPQGDAHAVAVEVPRSNPTGGGSMSSLAERPEKAVVGLAERSEERRVGKECRSRWSTDHKNKQKQNAGATSVGDR